MYKVYIVALCGALYLITTNSTWPNATTERKERNGTKTKNQRIPGSGKCRQKKASSYYAKYVRRFIVNNILLLYDQLIYYLQGHVISKVG